MSQNNRIIVTIFSLLSLSAICLSAQRAKAHGANVEVTQASVEIKAAFDTGEPMSEAQVIIYSPAETNTAWKTGKTDESGQFFFTPDTSQPGVWEVIVRKAGHGQTTTFSVGDSAGSGTTDGSGLTSAIARNSADRTPAAPSDVAGQKWITIAAVVWGFIGTALFFSGRPFSNRPSSPEPAHQPSAQQPASHIPGQPSQGEH